MSLTLDVVRPTARAARLVVVGAGPLAGLALLALFSVTSDPPAPLLVLVGLVVAAPAGHLLDDPAADVFAPSPTTLGRRRLERLALGGPLLALGWAIVVDRARFLDGFESLPLGALTVEVATFGLLTLAIAALAARHGDHSPGVTASVGLVMAVAVLFVASQSLPASLPVPQLDPGAHPRRWWWVGALSLAVLGWCSRDPGAVAPRLPQHPHRPRHRYEERPDGTDRVDRSQPAA